MSQWTEGLLAEYHSSHLRKASVVSVAPFQAPGTSGSPPEVSSSELYASALPCCTSPPPTMPVPINSCHLSLREFAALGPPSCVSGEAAVPQAALVSALGRSMVVGGAGAAILLAPLRGLLTMKGSLQLLRARSGGAAGSTGCGSLAQ